MQPATSFDVTGKWFRWSRYELLNGVVVPAEGASHHEYDPWEEFRKNEGRYRTVEQPYIALMSLYRELKLTAASKTRRSQPTVAVGEALLGPRNDKDAILQWCNRYGLLGLLPVLSNRIRYPLPDDGLHHEEAQFRVGGHWDAMGTVWHPSLGQRPKLAPHGFTWLDPSFGTFDEKPLNELRAFFLPNMRVKPENETFVPPLIMAESQPSMSFRRSYGEPVAEIFNWCVRVAECMETLSKWKRGGTVVSPGDWDVKNAVRTLNGLAQGVAPSFRFDQKKKSLEEPRISPGLLASYALMFLWDQIEGRRVLSCRNCDAYFVSNEIRAAY
jgi:hypothetical protein